MKKEILLVEDDRLTIDIYKTIFKFSGFKIEIIDTGEEAIEEIKKIEKEEKKAPDLIILDIILPGINGIEVLKEIKKTEKTRKIPVFVLTNYTDHEIEKEGYDLKAEKFILKTNYSPREIVKMVKERLKIK